MARVLTENQELLGRYLTAVGCDKRTVFKIILDLWDWDAVIEMLEYCRDNPGATQKELLKTSSIIYSKYKEKIESIPEWDDEEPEE